MRRKLNYGIGGGTAYLSVSNWRKINSFKFEELHRIANEKTVFIKLDTDGQDIDILLHNIPRLVSKPIIWYENLLQSQEFIRKTLKLFSLAIKYGYTKIIIFSDKGKLIYIGSLQTFTMLELKLIIKKVQNCKDSKRPYIDVVIIPKTLNISFKVLKTIF